MVVLDGVCSIVCSLLSVLLCSCPRTATVPTGHSLLVSDNETQIYNLYKILSLSFHLSKTGEVLKLFLGGNFSIILWWNDLFPTENCSHIDVSEELPFHCVPNFPSNGSQVGQMMGCSPCNPVLCVIRRSWIC